jgi:DNA-binding LacI/PurR family transcriptional regulator
MSRGIVMKRKTIGVLVGGITDDFTRLLCHGVIERAKTLDVNIVVIPGKFLDREYPETSDIYYEYQYQTLFSYATKENLDGVIVASSCIGCFATKERISEFMKRYLKMPCVIVAADEPDQICVRYDNGAGIREGLNYMIEELGYTRIGMIGGPDSNYDAKERRRTYIEALEAHGIEFDPELYVEGNLTSESKEVFRDILDRNPDMQGVFCVNDSCASGFYEELKARDILPGRDISVMGYDDIEWATQIYPTLSTVRADAGKLGSEAVNLMVRLIDGNQVESKILPTEFIRRDSFCKKGGSRKRSKNVIEGYLSMNHMLSEQWEERNKTQFKMKTFIQKVLSFDRGNDRSYGEILGTMDWLDIENAFIFLYKEPIIHLIGEPFELPDQLYLKTKDLKEKVSSVITVNQKVSSSNLYDFESLGVEGAGIYVLLPLYSNEILYGVLLCDLTEGVLVNGEFLGNQVSAAVKMINLLKTNEEIMKRLEESMAILQNRIPLQES